MPDDSGHTITTAGHMYTYMPVSMHAGPAFSLIGQSLEFYVLATSKLISGRVSTYKRVHFWQPYNAAPLADQATSTLT